MGHFETDSQAVLDSVSVFAIGLIAAALDRRWLLPATALACVWPSFIVYSSWVLTDILFVNFFAWGLCACLWAVKLGGRVSLLCLAGVAFGLAALTHPVLMFFPYLLTLLLVYMLAFSARIAWRKAIILATVPAVITVAMLVPRLVATNNAWGIPTISTQTGAHAASLAYPCLRNDLACDRSETDRRMDELYQAAVSDLTPEAKRNPVLIDRIWRKIAVRLMLEMPLDEFLLSVEVFSRQLLVLLRRDRPLQNGLGKLAPETRSNFRLPRIRQLPAYALRPVGGKGVDVAVTTQKI